MNATNHIISSFTNGKNLTNKQRSAVYNNLLRKSQNDKLPRGLEDELAIVYGISKRTVWRILSQGCNSIYDTNTAPNVGNKKKGNSGRAGYDSDHIKSLWNLYRCIRDLFLLKH